MEQLKGLSAFFFAAILAAILYGILASLLNTNELTILLNGLFAGAITAVAVTYGRLVLYAVIGKHPYDRVWQMTLGFAVLWAAVCTSVANSIYLQVMTDFSPPASDLTPLVRYLAIVAACIQVTAPDFGLGIFYGRDRKVLWAAISLGLIVAVAVILFQQVINA